MKASTYRLSGLLILAVFCMSFYKCAALLGIDEIRPVTREQAQRYLKSMGIRDTNTYQVDMACVREQVKNNINKDTSHYMYPLQNVLFEDGKLVSWIRVCDGNQKRLWENFPPQSVVQLNPSYTIEQELGCIRDFHGNAVAQKPDSKYVFFVYYIKKGGIVTGPAFRKFVKRSLGNLSEHAPGKDIKIMYVNANPKDSAQVY